MAAASLSVIILVINLYISGIGTGVNAYESVSYTLSVYEYDSGENLPKTVGPSIIPAIISPTTDGSLNRLNISPSSHALPRSNAKEKKRIKTSVLLNILMLYRKRFIL